jgi:hypothetical protein
MPEISSADADIIAMHLQTFSEVRLSYSRATSLCHQAKHFNVFRTILEQIANGERSNADLALMARNTLKAEQADRPTMKRKSKPLVRIAAG